MWGSCNYWWLFCWRIYFSGGGHLGRCVVGNWKAATKQRTHSGISLSRQFESQFESLLTWEFLTKSVPLQYKNKKYMFALCHRLIGNPIGHNIKELNRNNKRRKVKAFQTWLSMFWRSDGRQSLDIKKQYNANQRKRNCHPNVKAKKATAIKCWFKSL